MSEWYGALPERWTAILLKNAVHNIDEKISPNNVVYIGMENIAPWTANYISTKSVVEGISKSFQIGDILFGKLRPYLGKVFASQTSGACSGEFLVLRDFKGNHNYLKYLLLCKPLVMLIDSSTYGAKMPRANWTFIGSCAVPLPPRDEQDQIVRYLDWKASRINGLLRKLCGITSPDPKDLEKYPQSLIALLVEYRTCLISDVVTGKLDVRGVVVPEYEAVEEVVQEELAQMDDETAGENG